MGSTRRDFLKLAGAAASGIPFIPILARASRGASPAPGEALPGLFFDREDLPRIRRAVAHPHLAPWWQSITKADIAADAKFIRAEARLNDHSKDMLLVRQILERTSFVWAVTGDAAQLDVARRAVDKILEYPRWDYFLEGGEDVIGLQRAPEATIAMACASEWLAGALPRETIAEIEKQIAEKGAPACYRTLYGMKYPDRVRGWSFDPSDDYPFHVDMARWPLILNSTNLKAIPIAGLGVAGCLLKGKHPQADRWIDMAEQSARAFSVMYGPDGAYDEGVGYWAYTSTHMALLAEVFRRRLGKDITGIINNSGTVRYGLRMWMPTVARPNDCVNFSDAWEIGDVAVAAWTARRFNDRIAQFMATRVGQMTSPWSAIWLDTSFDAVEPGSDLEDVRFSNDWVVSRSGWSATDGVVALRSGGPANHEHADRNSVVFSAHGERIYHDPFHAAYPRTDPMWILRLTASHTAVLIDGKGHQYHDGREGTNASLAESHVVAYSAEARATVVTSDATAAYRLVNPGVALVTRTLVFVKPDVVVILDRVKLTGTPLPVQARFQVDNADGKGTVAAEGDAFVIRRPLATARTLARAAGRLAVRTGTLGVPASDGVFPYAEVESAPALDHEILTVCAAAGAGQVETPAGCEKEGTHWRIALERRGLTVDIDVAPGVPVVTVR